MLPALPLIAVGIAAAAAGWAGASWWAKLQARPDDAPMSPRKAGAGTRPAAGEARPLTWCPECRTWFVVGEPRRCDRPDCSFGG